MRAFMPQPFRAKGGTFYIRKVVPKPLREAVGKTSLDRSLRTKDAAVAKRRAPDVLAEFDLTLERAQ